MEIILPNPGIPKGISKKDFDWDKFDLGMPRKTRHTCLIVSQLSIIG
jgi:hypothetical protein